MRPAFLALVVLIGSAVGSIAFRPAVQARADGTFRVATYNIHKGADADNHYHLQRTIEMIASLDADVVGLQEVMRNHPAFDCDDQAALIAQGLARITGRPWSYVFERSWIWQDRTCEQRGLGYGADTEGLVLLTPHRIVSSSHVRLPESRIGLMITVDAAPAIPVVVTHLASSRRNQPQRVAQLAALLPWAAGHGRGILLGDLNARADAIELDPLFARYRDAWTEALAASLVDDAWNGSTRPAFQSRIDYVFYAADAPLTLAGIDVRRAPSSEDGLLDVSDHLPVIATFRVRSSQ
jgi:endonuclease/exonuclease/phosphatase family metal-dependent hydrolase